MKKKKYSVECANPHCTYGSVPEIGDTLCPPCRFMENLVLKRIIGLVRRMPNADDRLDLIHPNGIRLMTLDGGSVHRFDLIKKLEEMIK